MEEKEEEDDDDDDDVVDGDSVLLTATTTTTTTAATTITTTTTTTTASIITTTNYRYYISASEKLIQLWKILENISPYGNNKILTFGDKKRVEKAARDEKGEINKKSVIIYGHNRYCRYHYHHHYRCSSIDQH
ncbi:hypothetical protein DINM_003303 [Dirofilaria immitis]|nr:hypothetical protein [Dirofilaria immitis]